MPEVSRTARGRRRACRRVPEVSVIVPHLNQPELLAAAARRRSTPRTSTWRRAEVIVVDNGSRALPRAVVAGFPGVTLRRGADPGAGAGAQPRRRRCRGRRSSPSPTATAGSTAPGSRRSCGISPRTRALDDPRRRHPAVPGRPGEPDRGRGLRMRLRLPADPLHLPEGLFGDRQHGDAARGCSTRSGRSRGIERLRGPRLGSAGARPRPRHPLAPRRDRPPPGAAHDGRAARQDRPHRQLRLPHRRGRPRRAGEVGRQGAGARRSRRSPRSRASPAPTGSPASAPAGWPSGASPASGSTGRGGCSRRWSPRRCAPAAPAGTAATAAWPAAPAPAGGGDRPDTGG